MNVYIIASDGGMCKIGKARDPEKRVGDLRTGHPYRLTLAHVFPVESEQRSYEIEQAAHTALSNKKMVGEWFEVSPDDARDVIEGILNPPVVKQLGVWHNSGIAKIVNDLGAVQCQLVNMMAGGRMGEECALSIGQHLEALARQVVSLYQDDEDDL